MAFSKRYSAFSPAQNNDLYLYTKGLEFSLNGLNYIGEYHLIGGVPKTGPIPSDKSEELHRAYQNPDHYTYDKVFNFKVPTRNFIEPKPYIYKPDEQDYIVGSDARYFIEKVDDELSFAIEIDQKQYRSIGRPGGIDGGLYLSAAINWKLTGKREDIIKQNEDALYLASKKIPSINYAVKNFLEFARITLT